MWNLEKNGTYESIYKAGVEMQMQEQTCGHGLGGKGGRVNWESTIYIYIYIYTHTLLCVKQIASGNLLYIAQGAQFSAL